MDVWIPYIKQYSLQYLRSVDCDTTILSLLTAIKTFWKKKNILDFVPFSLVLTLLHLNYFTIFSKSR